MRLFKIKTSKITKDSKPDIDSIIYTEDLNLNLTSLPTLKKTLVSENVSRQLNSNDVFSLKENGRTLVYRYDDYNWLWIIDIDHKDYLRFQRDNKLNLILG